MIAGSLESANSSILAAHNLFKDFGGEKNQDFMIIRWPISWFVYQWHHFMTSFYNVTRQHVDYIHDVIFYDIANAHGKK